MCPGRADQRPVCSGPVDQWGAVMRSGRDRTERSDGQERKRRVRRSEATAEVAETNVRNEERAVRTIQQTLGNQALQGLRKSGELDRFLSSSRPAVGPGPVDGTQAEQGASPARGGVGAPTPDGEPPTGTAAGTETTVDTPAAEATAVDDTSGGSSAVDAPAAESRSDEPIAGEPATAEVSTDATAPTTAAGETTPSGRSAPVEPPASPERVDGAVSDTATAAGPASVADDASSVEAIEESAPPVADTGDPGAEAPESEAGADAATPVGPAGRTDRPGEVEPPGSGADATAEQGRGRVEGPADRGIEGGEEPPATEAAAAETDAPVVEGAREDESTGEDGEADGSGSARAGSDRSGGTTGSGPTAESATPVSDREPTGTEEASPAPEPVAEPVGASAESGSPATGTVSDGDSTEADAGTPAGEPAGPAAPAAPGSGTRAVSQLSAAGVQPKLTVGRPNDRFEREADAVAAAVRTGQPPPIVSRLGSGSVDALALQEAEQPPETPESGEELVQTRAGIGGPGTGQVPSSTASTIRSPGPGRPVPQGVRNRIEPQLGTSLDGVQVHTGSSAARAAGSLGARAFTHGSDVFLGNGESAHDLELMAHEATHVVQQGAVADRRDGASPSADVQRFVPDWILEELNDYARYIPGWTLFTVIIGYNPLTGNDVERTPTNLVEGLLGLLPAIGPLIFDALQEYGVLGDAFEWVTGELGRLDLSLERLRDTIEAAWEDVSLVRGLDYNLEVLERHFGGLYEDVKRFAGSVVDEVMRLIREAVVGVAEELLANSETLSDAWELLKKILGTDPLRDEEVEATPTEILEDFLLLIGQEEHLRQMRERGTVEETAEWIATQIERFQGLLGQLSGLISAAWEAIQPENLPNLANNLRSLVSGIGTFLTNVWEFASTVAAEVLERIKDALLGWLADYANHIPGFHLLTVIVGRNPFTGEAVPRTAQNLIRGFITLLPGGEAVYQQLAEAGVIEGAAGRIEAALTELGITWDFVVGVFAGIWESLSIEDLVSPIETFARIVDRFGEPISRLFAFVNVVLREVFFLLLAAMNFPVDIVESIITNVMSAIADIRNDPVGFLTNMLSAIKLGFQNFFGNILTHLAGGLADWLFRGLRGAGIEPPTDLSFQSVLDFVLEVLGVTTERLWEKLAERIGQENVDRIRGAIDRLTGILEFVGDVQERGVVAIWEYVQGQLTGLWDMVIEKAREWIMERVINRAVQWLMSLLDPSGIMAVVNSVRSFIAAVQSAVEYARDILAIVADYASTIAAVARGEVGPGAEKLEQGLANAIPVAIGFLMNQLGLGNVGEKIQEIIAGLRGMVDRALTWLVDRAVSAGESVLRTLGVGGGEGEGEEETEEGGDYDGQVGETVTWSAAGNDHRLWVVTDSSGVSVMMASGAGEDVENPLEIYRDMAAEKEDPIRSDVLGLVSTAERATADIRSKAADLKTALESGDLSDGEKQRRDEEIEGLENTVKIALKSIEEKLGIVGEEGKFSGENKRLAIARLEAIRNPADVSSAMVYLESEEESGILQRYKEEYRLEYLEKKKIGDDFQWPLVYLQGRAARKRGRVGETDWIAETYGSSLPRGRPHQVEQEDGSFQTRIPDYMGLGIVGDVKDVASQSFTAQLRDFYTIAKLRDPNGQPRQVLDSSGSPVTRGQMSFELIVRGPEGSPHQTNISGPLETGTDEIHYTIVGYQEENE